MERWNLGRTLTLALFTTLLAGGALGMEPVIDPFGPPAMEPVIDPFGPPAMEPVIDPFGPPAMEPVIDPFGPPATGRVTPDGRGA